MAVIKRSVLAVELPVSRVFFVLEQTCHWDVPSFLELPEAFPPSETEAHTHETRDGPSIEPLHPNLSVSNLFSNPAPLVKVPLRSSTGI
jgi:hypothetical protein